MDNAQSSDQNQNDVMAILSGLSGQDVAIAAISQGLPGPVTIATGTLNAHAGDYFLMANGVQTFQLRHLDTASGTYRDERGDLHFTIGTVALLIMRAPDEPYPEVER